MHSLPHAHGQIVQGTPLPGACNPQVPMGTFGSPNAPPMAIGTVVGAPADRAYAGPYAGHPNTAWGTADEDIYPAEELTFVAWFVCCCCCWIPGINAIIKAREISYANGVGDFRTAHLKRREALRLIYITVVLGIFVDIAYIIYRTSKVE